MTVNANMKHMMLPYQASSLYSAIADGQFKGTSAGKANWMSVIAGSSLQQHCNQEGFNIHLSSENKKYKTYVRLGFVANNEEDCLTCDSWIGFGVYYVGCNTGEHRTCGNRAVCATEPTTDIPAFGYIFVQ